MTEAEVKIRDVFAGSRWFFAAITLGQAYAAWFHARYQHAFGLDVVSALVALYLTAVGWSAHRQRKAGE